MACLEFTSLDAAKRFCEKHGWEYDVRQPKGCVGANGVATIPGGKTSKSTAPKGYGSNFSVKRRGIPDVNSMNPRPTPPDESVAFDSNTADAYSLAGAGEFDDSTDTEPLQQPSHDER